MAQPSRLLGKWSRLRGEGQADDDPVTMEFAQNGRLKYVIGTGDRLQIIELTYEVIGDEIVTDQPSRPQIERSRYYFEDPDTLVVEFDGLRTWLRRDSGPSAA
jgi:hypothetical protein